MTKRPVTDIAASIRVRLANHAKATGRPFQEVLQYFAMERFLYRLARSPHVEKFVLKGALMFTAWRTLSTRPTKDIDLLARLNNQVNVIVPIIREICFQEVEPDGLTFDSGSFAGKVIKEDADYEGVRVTFLSRLQRAQVRMQLDLGFGDTTTPPPAWTEFPTILDLPAPRVLGYSRETVVAEKFEAMVKLGLLNSRMKDFFDIWILARQYDFDGRSLASAVQRTLANRETDLSPVPLALTTTFADDAAKVAQWRGFCRKLKSTIAPEDLAVVIDDLGRFLLPVADSIATGRDFSAIWRAPGPWGKVL